RARLGRRRRRDGDAVRRRVERVRRRRAEARRPQGRGHDRPAPNGQGEGGRQDLARRADRGRYLRPCTRSAASPARAHTATFPAELRIFNARRLDCDARWSTLYTHIEDFVESLRTVTPRGVIESRRLPGSGAGPSPDRMMIGSEGILGIITQAWMRLQDRPKF